MAKSFVFLELTNPEVRALIQGIRLISNGVASTSPPHVTIRGPYSKVVPPSQIKRYSRMLATSPVVLEGTGTFEFAEKVLVYIKVQHDRLRQVWWKPDFPIAQFGFNPHITLYEGSDRERAVRINEFLVREKLKLLTWDFAVAPYVSDHKDLFPAKFDRDESFLGLINHGQIRPDFLDRLQRTVNASKRAA